VKEVEFSENIMYSYEKGKLGHVETIPRIGGMKENN
jgi:hypothetical protein